MHFPNAGGGFNFGPINGLIKPAAIRLAECLI